MIHRRQTRIDSQRNHLRITEKDFMVDEEFRAAGLTTDRLILQRYGGMLSDCSASNGQSSVVRISTDKSTL